MINKGKHNNVCSTARADYQESASIERVSQERLNKTLLSMCNIKLNNTSIKLTPTVKGTPKTLLLFEVLDNHFEIRYWLFLIHNFRLCIKMRSKLETSTLST